MSDFEIFFSDLNEDAQKRLMAAVGITDPADMNWDGDFFPIAFYPIGENVELNIPEKDDVDVNRLAELMGEEYERIYDAHDDAPGYREAICDGDKFIAENQPVISQLAAVRGDLITSDREVAALWFAWKRLKEETIDE